MIRTFVVTCLWAGVFCYTGVNVGETQPTVASAYVTTNGLTPAPHQLNTGDANGDRSSEGIATLNPKHINPNTYVIRQPEQQLDDGNVLRENGLEGLSTSKTNSENPTSNIIPISSMNCKDVSVGDGSIDGLVPITNPSAGNANTYRMPTTSSAQLHINNENDKDTSGSHEGIVATNPVPANPNSLSHSTHHQSNIVNAKDLPDLYPYAPSPTNDVVPQKKPDLISIQSNDSSENLPDGFVPNSSIILIPTIRDNGNDLEGNRLDGTVQTGATNHTASISSSHQSSSHHADEKHHPVLEQSTEQYLISTRPSNGRNPCNLGDCVPFHLCANGSIITDGNGLIDVRFGEEDGQTEEHPCPGALQTCCTEQNPPQLVRPLALNWELGCGHRNEDGIGFKIARHDNEAQFAEFPWTVAILKEDQQLNEIRSVYQCGGSLIHRSVVLTAAHCVFGKAPRTLKIRAGEWDTQTKDELFEHQERYVADYVIHEHFATGNLFNDVALLFLAEPVEIFEAVNTICMPPQGMQFDLARCFATGWGKDKFGKEGKYQVILKSVELPVVPRDECQSHLRTTKLGKYFILDKSFICAGGDSGRDTCQGDGGSPLVCPIPNTLGRFYQAGIVAWGIGCGDDQMPGVYVNVPLYRNWIDSKVEARNLLTDSYAKL